jgi:hypothetical protein
MNTHPDLCQTSDCKWLYSLGCTVDVNMMPALFRAEYGDTKKGMQDLNGRPLPPLPPPACWAPSGYLPPNLRWRPE